MLMKVCPKCGAKNDSTAMFCSACYVPLRSVAATEQVAVEEKVKICPKCGTESSKDTVVCPTCFTPIVNVAPTVKNVAKVEKASSGGLIFRRKSSSEGAVKEKSDFAYRVSRNKVFGLFDVHINVVKDLVFNSSYVNSNKDYNAVAQGVNFIFNDFLEDKNTVNAYAATVHYLMRRYGNVIPNLSNASNDSPIIMYYDGMNMAITTLAAAFFKFFAESDDMEKNYSVLSDFMADMYMQFVALKYDFDEDGMRALDLKYDIFPSDENVLAQIANLSMAASSFIVGHELGHIIHGHVAASGGAVDGVYSRNQERAADRFAVDVISSFENEAIKEQCFLGGVISHFVFLALGDIHNEVDVNDPRSHPAAYERFSNYLESNKDLAEKLGFSKDVFENCVRRFRENLKKL